MRKDNVYTLLDNAETETVEELHQELVDDVEFDLEFPVWNELQPSPEVQELYVDTQLLKVAL